jgi:Uma2 family endonuclease
MNPIPVSTLVSKEEIHRVTMEEYRALTDSGCFDDVRVELIDGLIVDMGKKSPQHENAVRWLQDWLIAQLDHARFQFMIAGSLTLGTSEPEPDVAIMHRTPPSIASHPSASLLVIEVAWSSHVRDRRTKPTVYAPTVEEYWVVDLDNQIVVIHRASNGSAYRDVTTHPRGAIVTPVSAPLGEVDTDALFAFAFAER